MEKLKISGLAAELSWNGPVPVNWWIFPSVAFEGLPLSLRSFSISHSYGTVEEHLQSVASHYFSLRRGVDLVLGVFWRKPFFLPREIVTYILASVSDGLQASERGLLTLVSSPEVDFSRSLSMYRVVAEPVLSFTATLFPTLTTPNILLPGPRLDIGTSYPFVLNTFFGLGYLLP